MTYDQTRQQLNATSAVNWRTQKIQKLEILVRHQMDRPSGPDIGVVQKHRAVIAELERSRSVLLLLISIPFRGASLHRSVERERISA
jgi:hypothetical protein